MSTTPRPNERILPSISTLTATLPNSSTPPYGAQISSKNGSPNQRDSGNWSMPPSARSSAYSACTNNFQPYQQDGSPQNGRLSVQPDQNIVNGAAQSSASIQAQPCQAYCSDATPNGALPSLTQNFEARNSIDQDSRRNSIDSRMHNGMNALALNTPSPYASQNASQVSLTSNLARERGIPQDFRRSDSFRMPRLNGAQPLSPLGPRPTAQPRANTTVSRQAPAISTNPRPEVYNAENPTASKAWAFPDPDAAPNSSSSDLTAEDSRPSAQFSRRGSLAPSFTSSISQISQDSRLPPGQRELPGTHHHTLQHSQVSKLIGDPDSPNGTLPYSRTPELRQTHKLAERKRRSEMKDLFETLRARLPGSAVRSSKWEILARGNAHSYSSSFIDSQCRHNKHNHYSISSCSSGGGGSSKPLSQRELMMLAIETINHLENQVAKLEGARRERDSRIENDESQHIVNLTSENQRLKVENAELRAQLQRIADSVKGVVPTAGFDREPPRWPSLPQQSPNPFGVPDHDGRPLPPIMNGNANVNGNGVPHGMAHMSSAMNGIQYTNDIRNGNMHPTGPTAMSGIQYTNGDM